MCWQTKETANASFLLGALVHLPTLGEVKIIGFSIDGNLAQPIAFSELDHELFVGPVLDPKNAMLIPRTCGSILKEKMASPPQKKENSPNVKVLGKRPTRQCHLEIARFLHPLVAPSPSAQAVSAKLRSPEGWFGGPRLLKTRTNSSGFTGCFQLTPIT